MGLEEVSTATSCTYEGEYNIYGKRHGDGELRWSNGDRYVGKFKDGSIEGSRLRTPTTMTRDRKGNAKLS